jgi:pimeloyl-ACP methyl ester carboxylesterase
MTIRGSVEFKAIDAGVLNVAYAERTSGEGWPVVLLHGFPYDVHAYDEVAERLFAKGARVIVPYLRGYGTTRFLSPETARSGQQGALGADLLALLDALDIESAILAGYDWGGRAACVVAALWPERAAGLVSVQSYNIQSIAKSAEPADPETEHRLWYQYYFHSERGRAGLRENRRELCKLLWRLWSPKWAFTDQVFEQSAKSFHNPDFVDVVIQSYRHRFALAKGDPAYADIERRLGASPPIAVPTITIDGGADGVAGSGGTAKSAPKFTGLHEHRVFENVGHNVPQEAPERFADAVLTVRDWRSQRQPYRHQSQ